MWNNNFGKAHSRNNKNFDVQLSSEELSLEFNNAKPIFKKEYIEDVEHDEFLAEVKIENQDNNLQVVLEEAKGENMELIKENGKNHEFENVRNSVEDLSKLNISVSL